MIARTTGLPDAWDEEADLVVLGSGAGGLTGALVAAIEGLSSVILEKTELVGGTTSISGGGIWIPLNHHMAEVGVEDSREEALEYVRACAGDHGDDDIHVALVDRGAEMLSYLDERAGVLSTLRAWPGEGGTVDYRPWLPGSKHGGRSLYPNKFRRADLGEWDARVRTGAMSAWIIDKLEFKTKMLHALPPEDVPPYTRARDDSIDKYEYFAAGSAVVGDLLKGCLAHDVRIFLETPGEELLVDDGRVVGVRAVRDGEPWFVRARRGVLIATGGFSHNEELKRLWLSRPLDFSCEIVENQGDGHLMGMSVGAQVAGLGDAWWMPFTPMEDGPLDSGDVNIGGTRDDRGLPHTMVVNSAGKRFFNEAINYYDTGEPFGVKTGAGPRNFPCWMIFDSQGPKKYSALATRIPKSAPPAHLTVGNTLEELAAQLGIDERGLLGSVERFNEFARAGVDDDFHRGESTWDQVWGDQKHEPNKSLGTIEEGPFYAVEIRPGALATRGGLRVNTNGQVLSAGMPFDPIPGLYAAGNCSSAGPAGSYPGAGCTIGAAMTFAYLVGKHAAEAADPLEPTEVPATA
jgi:3-oxosteroid 1-dehydrogenase